MSCSRLLTCLYHDHKLIEVPFAGVHILLQLHAVRAAEILSISALLQEHLKVVFKVPHYQFVLFLSYVFKLGNREKHQKAL